MLFFSYSLCSTLEFSELCIYIYVYIYIYIRLRKNVDVIVNSIGKKIKNTISMI